MLPLVSLHLHYNEETLLETHVHSELDQHLIAETVFSSS